MNSYRESCHDNQNLEAQNFFNKNSKTQYNWNFMNSSEMNLNPKQKKDKYSNFTGSLALSAITKKQKNQHLNECR